MWHDTIHTGALELGEWEKEWRDEAGAGEVVRAVGALVVVIRKPALAEGKGGLVCFLFSSRHGIGMSEFMTRPSRGRRAAPVGRSEGGL